MFEANYIFTFFSNDNKVHWTFLRMLLGRQLFPLAK